MKWLKQIIEDIRPGLKPDQIGELVIGEHYRIQSPLFDERVTYGQLIDINLDEKYILVDNGVIEQTRTHAWMGWSGGASSSTTYTNAVNEKIPFDKIAEFTKINQENILYHLLE